MSKKKKQERKTKGTKDNHQQLRDSVLQLFDSNISKGYTPKQVIKKLGFRQKTLNKDILQVMKSLLKENKIATLSNGSYRSTRQAEVVVGKLDHVSANFGYVVTEEGQDDVYVKGDDLFLAMDGDTVSVAILSQAKHGRKAVGRIVKVLERHHKELVGKIEFSPRFAFVVPDNRKIHQDIFVNLQDALQAQHNDKVIVQITQWPNKDRSPEGKVVRILGKAGEHNAEIHSIMAEFGLPFEFPEAVEEEANRIDSNIDKAAIKKRRDFREVTTFTIDPLDAKDFDDAISIQKIENGHYQIGIHIADVTHYVQPRSLLEKEAYHRATSVYLVDRTIPMLPERLSNGLCSLRPNEDKYTFSVVFEMDENGKIYSEWFGRTLIHSDRRFTYEEAQERIDTAEGDFAEEINTLNGLAYQLKDRRFDNGAVNFETDEVRFRLDEDGKPLEVIPKVRQDAHKLVEEFMLLANRQVATFIYKMKQGKEKNTFVYRTHDHPDPEKITVLKQFASKFGYSLDNKTNNASKSINQLLTQIEGKREQNILQTLAIRAMAKAKYTTDTDGHFGLAFEHYSHFTSPIRRYPDMMVHRLLQHYLDGGKSVEKATYEQMCTHSSEREKRASDAERASIKYKQVEYMQMAEDVPYQGVISGVTEWGVFVEITKTRCEGMVRLIDMTDDYYEYDEDNYRIIGKRNKKMYRLGDIVTVRVIDTNIDRRTIDLRFDVQ